MESKSTIQPKTALYCRVSTHKQTVDNQKLILQEYARKNEIDYLLFEEVESTKKTRPVKQELLRMARCGEVNEIIVYKLDRFARSFTELILEIQELIDKEISFKSLTENLDFSTSSGKLQFRIISAFANFERDIISERTRDGIARAKAKGKKLGRPMGSKDKEKRSKSGYILREANKRKKINDNQGNYQALETYIK